MTTAKVLILPVICRLQGDVDLACQCLSYAGAGRNVVDLRRVRLNRAFAQLNAVLDKDRRASLPAAAARFPIKD